MARTHYLEGPAGAGKTDAAIAHIRDLLTLGVRPDSILVLIPHPALGEPYRAAAAAPDWPAAGSPEIVTLARFAQRQIALFWPLVAEKAGFQHPEREPQFLSVETAQYHMAGFVHDAVQGGLFDNVNITEFRIMTETLNNLARAAINGFTLDEVEGRLISAWGPSRHSSRPQVYRASLNLARHFRAHCLEHGLLDFSLQIEVFMRHLLPEPLFRAAFLDRYRHLVADNLEENFPAAADFVRWLWDDLNSAWLITDRDGGYRTFLGADPEGMRALADLCDEQRSVEPSNTRPVALASMEAAFAAALDGGDPPAPLPASPLDGFTAEFHRFYPEMVEWVTDRITALVADGTPPHEIVVLVPLLNDALRFTLIAGLEQRGVPVISHRPSRPVRDEPAARTLLTLTALAHPEWDQPPPTLDIADALQHAITELDPVRAWLLAQIVYRPGREPGAFEEIEPASRERITYAAGGRYDALRAWLLDYQAVSAETPTDHFLSRLFGEVLSQPGYGFHTDLQAGRVVAELVASARRFRQTIYPEGFDDWSYVTREYVRFISQGMLGGLYLPSWQHEEQEAVFVAPAHTFLLRNRPVAHQFWLDVGSSLWWERLEQPLTHPYVLLRGYPAGAVWTDEDEYYARQEAMRRLVIGLIRHATRHITLNVSQFGERGDEQRGPLLRALQHVLRHYAEEQEHPA